MAMATGNGQIAGRSSGLGSALWIVAAVIACLSVLAVNGRPLFYFDTVGYISQGHSGLKKLGIVGESPLAGRIKDVATNTPDASEIDAAQTVDGSRSTVYALVSGALARLGALEGLIAMNVIAVLLAVWLPMRIAARRWGLHMSVAQAVSVPVIVASLGSLPFFVSYLMPDTFAPVLILTIGTITVFGRQMTVWEMLLAVALGSFAIVAHLSHLAIATVMIPVVALVALVLSRRRWWLAPALVLIMVGIGFAEQSVLRSAAKSVANSEVVIKPYITARIIEDGPGLSYLDAHCPDDTIPTCKLHAALQLSDDPFRITASHIVFETSERLGSFRLMTAEDQRIVADDQIGFFFEVLADQPIALTLAFLKNTLIQSGWTSVDMTLQNEPIIAQHAGVSGLMSGAFEHGRLTRDIGWLVPVTTAHHALYILSLLVIVALVLLPHRVPREIKALAIMVLLGVLANALVCGGISQPATRYGARVIWLLPLVATILAIFARRSRQFEAPGEGRV
ncbi:hypothetical protein OEZ71_04180 [Defluviimonas sp. WL0050]|uniref:Transmembrane protein n=1 Tax=Albidovulum litorale TaxID=2984134 RepID=A0ABT2ZK34_9RHOB|nr:hypothetical protein [Defluviimonas sp. WL0050]MCV2871489.1 hypothetical protein [Defluviimonas sp. WL0050]